MADWIIEPFARHHDRSSFSCGKLPLDDFIQTRVSQYERRRLGKTYVAIRNGEQRVIGYYTLAAGAVAFENLPDHASRKLPKHPVPVVLLARLAVDLTAQGKGLGDGLLLDALQRACDLSSRLGVYAVKVDAIDESAASFYQKYGFTSLVDVPMQLYLPIASFEKLLE